MDQIGERYGEGVKADLANAKNAFDKLRGDGVVENAEEFLGYVEDPENSKFVLENLAYSSLGTQVGMRENYSLKLLAVRRLLAIQCAHFVTRLRSKGEGRELYGLWGSTLNEKHAIVTFNYDTLVEKIVDRQHLYIPTSPAHDGTGGRKRTWLLKMHGSTDWRAHSDIEYTEETDAETEREVADAPLIGIPGAGKYALYGSPLFRRIWGCAEIALKRAKKIVFLGYSMPASDLAAMKFICDCVKENQTQYLGVEIVLGPEGPHTTRLKTIISLSLQKRALLDSRVDVLPIYAQDYLASMPVPQGAQ